MSELRLPTFRRTHLDAELVFGRCLGAVNDLDVFQGILARIAPRWSAGLRLWVGGNDQHPIDVRSPGALTSAVVAAASERGPTYRTLVARYGKPELERMSGSAELRGAGGELIIVVTIDEIVLSPLGERKALGNSIALQVRGAKVERKPGREWLRDAFAVLCGELCPVWGAARHEDEYWAKVMTVTPRIEAVGRDFGRFLPGLFWLNFFGRPYRRLLGDERLRSAPGRRAVGVGDGVLIELHEDPLAWDTPQYVACEQGVRDYLGPELFYSRTEPDRATVVPQWSL